MEHLDSGLYNVVKYVNRYVPPDARILTFRQSDIGYYTKHPIAVQFDPENISLFNDTLSAAEIAVSLSSRGIHYIHVPHYTEPAIYSSSFGSFLSDPQHVELLIFSHGARLYRVLDPGERNEISFSQIYSTDFGESSFGLAGWNFFQNGRFFDREPNSTLRQNRIGEGGLELASNQSFNLKRSSRVLTTGAGRFEEGLGTNAISVRPGSELRLCLTSIGSGYFSFFVHEYDIAGRYLGSSPAWEAAANSAEADSCFFVRSGIEAHNLRLELIVPSFSAIRLDRLNVEEVSRTGSASQQDRAGLLSSDWLVRDEHFRIGSAGLDWFLSPDGGDSITLRNYSSSALVLSSPVVEVPVIPNRISVDLSGIGEVTVVADWVCANARLAWQTETPPTTLAGTDQRIEWNASSMGVPLHPQFKDGAVLRLLKKVPSFLLMSAEPDKIDGNDLYLWTPDHRASCEIGGSLRGRVNLLINSRESLPHTRMVR